MPEVSPSILASDLSNLAEVLSAVETADRLHIDIMDGHFVPNISMGFPIVESLQGHTPLPIDLHMMVANPLELIDRVSTLDIDSATIHVEAIEDVSAFKRRAETAGITTGLAINPETDIDGLGPQLSEINRITVMGVTPGFTGQTFQPEVLEKVELLDETFDGRIEVDGGITLETARQCVGAGADILVSGSTIFQSDDEVKTIDALRTVSAEEPQARRRT
ncbi:ribulose-phosphate 3-epimerase [Halovenus sp. WSH3]|uniref:Ribulose-phosphate 3-epimerase n=1 Tax=Halovenus carboxidivorans TaxID=2692199 RepID=A0A6B0SZA6_9EURY|nr:ribulose-phosphate 3-epimerase [Halovenus carboxidivorans]MXR50994.1 ribulose-phosphate 3-epimerase [Halovenus carboxidivorans]